MSGYKEDDAIDWMKKNNIEITDERVKSLSELLEECYDAGLISTYG